MHPVSDFFIRGGRGAANFVVTGFSGNAGSETEIVGGGGAGDIATFGVSGKTGVAGTAGNAGAVTEIAGGTGDGGGGRVASFLFCAKMIAGNNASDSSNTFDFIMVFIY